MPPALYIQRKHQSLIEICLELSNLITGVLLPIEVTLVGTVTVVNPVHPENAYAPNDKIRSNPWLR